jgi:hypothetical protein
VRQVIGVLCCVVGVIWFGQGIGLIGGSFMTGDAVWAVIGAVALLFGVTLLRGARRSVDDG